MDRALRIRLAGRMNDGKRMAAVDCGTNSGDVGESDRQIQLVVCAAAPAS